MKGERGETGATGATGPEGKVPQWLPILLAVLLTLSALLSILIYFGIDRLTGENDRLDAAVERIDAEERITQRSVRNGCLRVNILRSRSNNNSYAVWSVLSAAIRRPGLPAEYKRLYRFSIDHSHYTPLTDCDKANRGTASFYVPPAPQPFTSKSQKRLLADQAKLDEEIASVKRQLK